MSQKPPYMKPLRRRNCRRANFHNYKAPGGYMITIRKAPGVPDYSRLRGIPGDPDNPPHTELTDCGRLILAKIAEVTAMPEFEIGNMVLMPDHMHLLWNVKVLLPRHLGHYVGQLKSQCSAAIRNIWPALADAEIFHEGFHDLIAFTEKHAERFSHYISDNPRRRLMVMHFPELFSRVQRVRICDRVFDVYGNFQLLKHPLITPAIVSSRYTPEEKRRLELEREETKRGQGVFISPFISTEERRLKNEILAEGGSIIRLLPDGMGERYKPAGDEFELCAQGRCLHIGEPRPSAHKDALTRRICLELNDTARWIASHPAETMELIRTAAGRRR